MKIRAQISMVLNLDKCIGCHTCSVTCKNVWTNRKGVEYAWFNNVESKPGIGFPKEWENQENLDRYLRSDRFGALLGANGLLCEPLEVKFKVVSHTTGIEAVSTARGRDISVTGRGRSSGTGFE